MGVTQPRAVRRGRRKPPGDTRRRVHCRDDHVAASPELHEGRSQPQKELHMTRRAKIWWVVAVLFTILNVVGAGYAAVQGGLLHAGVHGGLAYLGAYLIWRLSPRRVANY